ncbi:cytosine deaminase [Sporothrix schenckii 1099-18]|uniref:Cytosine deaminase n=1 Tax=Sporothrix schenckii 1099-18 TaxID=1397361 RepID=A0A0F2M9I0_SPOSC|nr:cytosine deaminase [Sporothrix schenckii 1099-18]KJR85744.1 cytosine deaminase [Sporothrix schenckii 1099-18]
MATLSDKEAFEIAYEEAKKGFEEGGVPIGAALVSADGKLMGSGRNLRVQSGSAIHHGETSALFNSGRRPAGDYKGPLFLLPSFLSFFPTRLGTDIPLSLPPPPSPTGSTMYTSLSPCDMCTGACLLYGVGRVVIGENRTFLGGEAYLKQRGVEVVVLDDPRCKALMDAFIEKSPDLWNEDIGVEEHTRVKAGTIEA